MLLLGTCPADGAGLSFLVLEVEYLGLARFLVELDGAVEIDPAQHLAYLDPNGDAVADAG